MSYRLLWFGAGLGVALHLAGLGWDAYMHARDATLASREGIFTLSNPSHALIMAGVALTSCSVFGVGLKWLADRGDAPWSSAARIARFAALPILGIVAAGSIWLVTLADDPDGHVHDAPAHDEAHVSESTPAGEDHVQALPGSATEGHSHDGSDAEPLSSETAHIHDEVAVSPEQLLAAASLYERVRATAERYEDIRVALADGYFQVTQDLPSIAAHFHHPGHSRDGELLNPDRPETLLYTTRLDGTWRLVGVMFSSEVPTDEPPSFFGALDVWHRHENLCFTTAAVTVRESAADCVGVFVPVTAWNLHVWTAPGGSGIFAHDFEPISPGPFSGAQPATRELLARNP